MDKSMIKQVLDDHGINYMIINDKLMVESIYSLNNQVFSNWIECPVNVYEWLNY